MSFCGPKSPEIRTLDPIWLNDRQPLLTDKILMIREMIVVGAEGFEPPTSCSQSRRATGLRHAPTENS